MSRCLLPLAAAALLGLPAAARATPPDPVAPRAADEDRLAVTTWTLPADETLLATRDLDGDGRLDLVRLQPDGLGVRFLSDDFVFGEEDDAFLPWPGETVGWHILDFDGDGVTDVLMLLDGRTVRRWSLDEGRVFGEGEVLLEGGGGHLPRGVRHVPVAHDVDGDGRHDLVLPGTGTYRIHLQQPDGSYAEPIVVGFEARVDYDVGDPDRLDSRFGEEVEVPWFRLDDVDGDGLVDLVSETRDVVLFHLARPDLPREPTWRLPIGEMREAARSSRGIDFDDLLSNLDRVVTWRHFDLDGVPPRDLVLQEGGTFRIELGATATGPKQVPDMVLKSSGNVLYYMVRDVLGDPLPELQIIRGERVSLGDAIRMLLLPSSLDVDVFTYENTDGTFSKKPTRRSTVALQIPGLLAFFSEMDELEDEMKARFEAPTRRCCLDGDGLFNDLADHREGQLLLFRDALPAVVEDSISERLERAPGRAGLEALLTTYILEDLEAMEDGAVREIDLEDIKKVEMTPYGGFRDRTLELQPVLSLRTPFTEEADVSIQVTDLDADGVSDFVLLGEVSDDEQGVQLVVVRPADATR